MSVSMTQFILQRYCNVSVKEPVLRAEVEDLGCNVRVVSSRYNNYNVMIMCLNNNISIFYGIDLIRMCGSPYFNHSQD